MAKSNNQKGKILYLEKILLETGENRLISMQEILAELVKYGINAERKSIYDDLEVLRSFGMDIRLRRGRQGGYYLAGKKAPEKISEDPVVPEKKTKAAEAEKSSKVPESSVTEAVWKFEGDSGKKELRTWKLLCKADVRESVQAYFGRQAQYKEKNEEYFIVTVQMEESPRFFGWLTAMGREVHISKPKKGAQAYRDYLKGLAKEYKCI